MVQDLPFWTSEPEHAANQTAIVATMNMRMENPLFIISSPRPSSLQKRFARRRIALWSRGQQPKMTFRVRFVLFYSRRDAPAIR
jgi:hypothetical protein